jgi:hypothetical protein
MGAVVVSGSIGARAKGLVINIMLAMVCAGSSRGSDADVAARTAKPETGAGDGADL